MARRGHTGPGAMRPAGERKRAPLPVLLVAPVVFLAQDRGRRPTRHEIAEGVLLMAFLSTLAIALFSVTLPYVYAVFPVTALLAFRLGPPGAAMATAVVAGIATASTVTGHGPFTAHAQVHNLFLLQLFIGLMAVTGLVLSAVTAERREIAIGWRVSRAAC